MTGERPRVAVLHNAPTLPPDHPDAVSEAGVVSGAHFIAGALSSAGFDAQATAVVPPVDQLVALVHALQPDVVFNLIEGFGGRTGCEAYIAALLELMELPYTGCPPEALALCRHKAMAKALLRGFGLPTPPFAVVGVGDPTPALEWSGPVIVKPEAEDASLGIDQGSVVTSAEELDGRIAWVRQRYGPRVLVEAYLPGLELNVGILALPEPEALPVAEVVFQHRPGSWPILTYDAKWASGSAEDRASPVRCPAQVDDCLAERVRHLAISAFRATGCRDYARVDFRLDERADPMILEVNPNPDLGPAAGWARALGVSGRDYQATLVSLARQALARGASRGRTPD